MQISILNAQPQPVRFPYNLAGSPRILWKLLPVGEAVTLEPATTQDADSIVRWLDRFGAVPMGDGETVSAGIAYCVILPPADEALEPAPKAKAIERPATEA